MPFANLTLEESSPPDGEGAASDVAVVDDGPSNSDESTTEPPPETSEPSDSQEAVPETNDDVPAGEAPVNVDNTAGEPKEAETTPTEAAAESNEAGMKEANGVS